MIEFKSLIISSSNLEFVEILDNLEIFLTVSFVIVIRLNEILV